MTAGSSTLHENDVVVEAWNTVLFDKFERFKHLLVAGLAGHSDELLSRGLFRPGERVLDVGCGFGDSTIKIAGLVGPSGEAVGVDCAERFIATGEQRRRGRGRWQREILRRRRAGRRPARALRPGIRALRHHVLHVAGSRAAEHPQVAEARRALRPDRVAQARGQSLAARRGAARARDRAGRRRTRKPTRSTAGRDPSRCPAPTW